MPKPTKTFHLYIDTDNDAFTPEPNAELARILRAIADKVEGGEWLGQFLTVFDANGNDVGRYALKAGYALRAVRGG